ncbi:MAG: SGNH/GDSL hydrolase family protein [Bacteroidota bacterium]
MIRLLSLLLINALFSCDKENVSPTPVITDSTTMSPKKDTTYYWLALGDSYTIGQSVATTDRYPVQTAAILEKDTIHFAAPEIIAQTGWTTANLINRINSTPPTKNKYDIVSLLIGVNNQYQGLSQDQYRTEFTLLLNKAIAFANNKIDRVIVLSIPDYSVTPFATSSDTASIRAEIDAFNLINKQISMTAGVHYIDITSSTRMALTDASLIAFDGLHPSGKEYAKWAEWLAPIIKNALKN